MFSKSFLKASIASLAIGVAASGVAQAEVKLQGSGASFPFPIYAKWFKDFSAANDGIRVDYQSKGSGAGIKDFIAGVTDFGGSDAAMDDEEIAQSPNGAMLLPMTAGQVTLSYNLPGVGELKLPRAVYPEIFAGKITKWNDPALVAANPGVDLPDQNITVVVRSDSSGTTYVFTGHLATISESFKAAVGHDKAPQWPLSFVKAPKNDGVTATIKQTPGAIGYIEYGYAKLSNSPTALLENQEGNFVAASAENGSAALAGADWPEGTLPGTDIKDLRAWAWDPTGASSYPIATFTWMMVPTKMDADKADAMKKLVEYVLTEGQEIADSMGYIPLPESVKEMVRVEVAKL